MLLIKKNNNKDCVWILALSVSVCVVPLAESEGTLILPQVESFHRLRDDDATTVTSDDSFFSAAEVSSFPLLYKDWQKTRYIMAVTDFPGPPVFVSGTSTVLCLADALTSAAFLYNTYIH